ncbi:MAG: response regulator [Planctomycetes bacterium]|nr:response regulator [Planctomycetota bacterium]
MRTEKKTILVVDDDVAILRALDMRLSEAGFLVLTAANSDDALEQAAEHKVDAITLDVDLNGDVDGLHVAKLLHEDPHTAHLPILFVTGTADQHFKQRCQDVGAKYFVSKPYDSDLLIRTLNAMLAADEIAELQRIGNAKRRQPTR